MQKLFVYGTLKNTTQLNGVIGHKYTGMKKRVSLEGYTKYGLNILESEGSSVDGYVIEVTDEELDKINHYEGLGWLYEMIDVEIDGHEDVAAYKQIDEGIVVVV